jgi:hypothetical protein
MPPRRSVVGGVDLVARGGRAEVVAAGLDGVGAGLDLVDGGRHHADLVTRSEVQPRADLVRPQAFALRVAVDEYRVGRTW